MSAYVREGMSTIIPIKGIQEATGPKPETSISLPHLPRIDQELEAYFHVARQLEATIQQERSLLRQYHQQIRDLARRNEILEEEKKKTEILAQRETTIKNREVEIHQRNENTLKGQLRDLSRQLEEIQHEKRKSELDVELNRANLELLKRREKSWSATVQSFQSKEAAYQKLVHELGQTRLELQRYKTAWIQASGFQARSQQAMEESGEAKRKLQETSEELSESKSRLEHITDLMKKEKRDKQLALNCLNTAEVRIEELSQEIERLRNQLHEKLSPRDLEVKLF